MKLANILLVEDYDGDAAFFRDFFERQRICNQVTRVRLPGCLAAGPERREIRSPGCGYSYSWQWWAGVGRADQGAARV